MAIYKNKDLEVDINVGEAKFTSEGAPIYTGDKGSASIRISIKHKKQPFNFNDSDMVPTLDLFHSDGSIWLEEPVNIIISDYGVIEYNIPENVISHAGKVNVKLFLKNTDISIHVLNFTFEISDSGIEGAVEKEISVKLVEDTIRKIISENALELLDNEFKTAVFDEFKTYTIANPEQFKGERGIDGPQGPRGVQGLTGSQGIQGIKGDKGDKGEDGIDGVRGPQGIQGPKGEKGNDVDYDTVTTMIKNDVINDKMDKVYKPLTSSVNIYVRPNGDDITGDGSTLHPFRTIQRAVDTVPKLIEKDHFIRVAEGSYDEEVTIKGISGSAIWISREGGIVEPDTIRPNVKIKSITYYDCNAYCKVESVEQLNSGEINGQGFIRFSRCSYGTVHACLMDDGTITKPTLVWDRSGGGFNSCHFNNQRQCVNSMNGSAIRCDATNTHGYIKSDIGIVVQAGEVYYNGNITWIENTIRPESYIQGGMINKYAVEIDLNTKNGWNSYSTDYRPRALKMPDGTVHLYGLVKDGVPGSGSIAFTLPNGYNPKVKSIYGGFVSDGTIGKILIDTSGNFAVESMTGQYISLSGITFYAGF